MNMRTAREFSSAIPAPSAVPHFQVRHRCRHQGRIWEVVLNEMSWNATHVDGRIRGNLS